MQWTSNGSSPGVITCTHPSLISWANCDILTSHSVSHFYWCAPHSYMTFFHFFFRGHPGNRLVSHFSQWSQESPCAPEIRGNYSWKPSKAQILTPNHQKVTSILLVRFFLAVHGTGFFAQVGPGIPGISNMSVKKEVLLQLHTLL